VREVHIELNREAYLAGRQVNGTVTVHTDEFFECEDFTVFVRGSERTRITVGSGDDRRTYRGSTKLVEHQLDVNTITRFGAGKTPIDFSFMLPMGLPPTYKGTGAQVKYWIEAKAAISWAFDCESQKKFWVFSPGARATTAAHRAAAKHKGNPVLELRLDETSVRLGDGIPFQFRVPDEIEIRGVRAELVHCQNRRARDRSRRTVRVLNQREIPDEEIQRNRWVDWSIPTRKDYPPTFKTRLITSWYFVRLTLDRPWRFDKSASVTVVPYFDPS